MVTTLTTKDTTNGGVGEHQDDVDWWWACQAGESVQKLRREYELLMFCNGQGVEDFAMWLAGIVNQLAMLGDPEPDDKVVLKYLRIAKPRYKQLVLSIETILDVSTLSIEEVTGWLKAVEEDGGESSVVEAMLLLTEEKWCERNKKKEVGDGSSGDCGGHGRGSDNRGWGRGRGSRDDGEGPNGRCDSCHRCGKPGHWVRECRRKQRIKKDGKAYAAQEEETGLLITEFDSARLPDPGDSVDGGRDLSDGTGLSFNPVAGGMHIIGRSVNTSRGSIGEHGTRLPLEL
jgi:hypothetical protein